MKTQRLHELIDAWRDGVLTEEGAAELSGLLRDSDDARRIFRDEAQMHGLLHQAVMAAAVEEAAGGGAWFTRPAAAAEVGGSWRPEARITSRKLLRTFSTPSVYEGEELIPFKPSEISSLDVVAAPGRLAIDGDLSDWDLSGRFEARCPGSFAESYFVEGSLMYDRQCLYIAARIGDPMPMRNLIDPGTDPWSAWMGGSLQLRLSTDRDFGWPLKVMRPSYRHGPDKPIPQDTSHSIVHLTLWYFQPREQPCLELRYGMNLDRGVVNPPGWQGAFRKAPDGKSYTLECAIPWTLLGAGADPPRTGDELGLCWTVNWSDASGKRWKGQLIEIKNPAYSVRGQQTFIFGETWGKAVYR